MEYDLVIRNGRIVDGTGGAWFRGDIGCKGDKIVSVGRLTSASADMVVDASELVVSPGFIDIHTHTEFTVLANPQAESYVRQGITTAIAGNCGQSPAPITKESTKLDPPPLGITPDWATFGEYFGRVEKQGTAINLGSFVGFGTCRIAAMGSDAWDRSPTADELEDMKDMVDKAMQDGAFGLSSGLEYPPQSFASTSELIELAKIAAKHHGTYATHIRSRDLQMIKATREAIEIGEKAGIRVQLSHFGARIVGGERTGRAVELVEETRKRGTDVRFDQIVYSPPDDEGNLWCFTGVASAMFGGSKYTFKGGRITLSMLKDPEVIESLRRDLPNRQYDHIFRQRQGLDNWDTFVLVHCAKSPQYKGKSFAEIGQMMGKDPFDAAIEILIQEGEEFPKVSGKFIISSLRDTNCSLLHPLCSVASDTSVTAPYGVLSFARAGPAANRPRSYGMFAWFFEKWVREYKILTLEDAVRKCTGLPAQSMGLMSRGLIRPGMCADIAIFDPKRIGSKATLEDPCRYAEGIDCIIVNGKTVIQKSEHTGALPGRTLRFNRL